MNRPCFLRAGLRLAIARIGAALPAAVAAAVFPLAFPAGAAESARQISYQGTLDVEAHYQRPGERRTYHSERRFFTDRHGRVRLDWTFWSEGDTTARAPETFLVDGNRVFHRPKRSATWELLAGEWARYARLQALAGLPNELTRDLKSHGFRNPKLTYQGKRLQAFIEASPHPRLGDVRDSMVYTYQGSEPNPLELLQVLHERDHQWRLTERRVSWSAAAPAESLLRAPDTWKPAANDAIRADPTVTPVAPGLWTVDLEDLDSRSMIVEFADHLAVIEVAVGSANGERIADLARRRWPGKPIRYALFSHHHPHYLGGLRAMIAEGATIVTTPGNEALVKSIAALPFQIEPDRLARAPHPVVVKTFPDRIELADSSNQLVAINYGERSQHTDEFAVFYFPRQRVLFEAEQGWIDTPSGLRPTRRAATLLAWLDEQKLDVDRIVQCWPMRGNEASLTRDKLRAMVEASRK